MKKSSILISLFISVVVVLSTVFDVYADPISGFDYENYYELEYIESVDSGRVVGQVIDTGYVFSSVSKTVTKFQFLETTSSQQMGTDTSPNDTKTALFGINSSSQFIVFLGLDHAFGSVDTNAHIYTIDGLNHKVWLDSNSYTLNNFSSPSNSTFSLFNRKNNGTYRHACRGRLYYHEVYESNNLVAKFIPAERKSDGVFGLYDTVNHTFKVNVGTGSFVGGPRIAYNYRTVSAEALPAGSGTFTGLGSYLEGTAVTVTAVPNEGYRFSHWYGGSTDNPRTYIVGQYNISFTAFFESTSTPVTEYTVTTNVNPSGSGSVTGGGTYEEGTNISLTAVPNTGYVFDSWSTGSTANPLTLQVNQDLTITANFTPVQSTTTYTISTVVSPAKDPLL